MSGIFCQKANANDIRLCHELINLPIKTPITNPVFLLCGHAA